MNSVNLSTFITLFYFLSIPSYVLAQDQGAYTTEPNFNTTYPVQPSAIERSSFPSQSPSAANSSSELPDVVPTVPNTDQILSMSPTGHAVGQIARMDDTKVAVQKSAAVKASLATMMPTPEWQSTFIRALVGGDGTLALISSDIKMVPTEINDVVNLDQAVSMALEHNPEIGASIEAERSKHWDKVGAYSQFLPVFQLDLATGRERSRPTSYNDEFGNRVTDNRHHRHDRILTVRQPLVDLGYIADIFGAQDKEEVAQYESKSVQDTIASDSASAYFNLIQSRISIKLAEEYKGYLDNLAHTMRARVEGGGASAADLDRVLSRSSQAESAQVEAESAYQTSLLELQRLTGAIPLKVKVPETMAPDVPESVEVALDSAYQNNAGYLAGLKKIDVANDDKNRAYAGLVPRVYAQYSSAYSYNPGGAANGNPVDGVYPTQRTDSGMLVAQWTINGGVPVAGGLSASAKARQYTLESLDARQKIDQGIRVSYSALDTSKDRLEVLQKTVEANERVVVGFEEQYKNGTRSVFELLDAYEQLYNSRLNLMRVIFAYTQASYQVRLQMGDIIPSIVKARDNSDGQR